MFQEDDSSLQIIIPMPNRRRYLRICPCSLCLGQFQTKKIQGRGPGQDFNFHERFGKITFGNESNEPDKPEEVNEEVKK